jgi:hypothetical protein
MRTCGRQSSRKTASGFRNIGPAAVDVRWSDYGDYLELMIESVQIEWERILIANRIHLPS